MPCRSKSGSTNTCSGKRTPTRSARRVPDWRSNLNPNSLEVVQPAYVEPSLAGAAVGMNFQFERLGYFCLDPDSTADKRVFNRTVTLKDTWAKIEKRAGD